MKKNKINVHSIPSIRKSTKNKNERGKVIHLNMELPKKKINEKTITDSKPTIPQKSEPLRNRVDNYYDPNREEVTYDTLIFNDEPIISEPIKPKPKSTINQNQRINSNISLFDDVPPISVPIQPTKTIQQEQPLRSNLIIPQINTNNNNNNYDEDYFDPFENNEPEPYVEVNPYVDFPETPSNPKTPKTKPKTPNKERKELIKKLKNKNIEFDENLSIENLRELWENNKGHGGRHKGSKNKDKTNQIVQPKRQRGRPRNSDKN